MRSVLGAEVLTGGSHGEGTFVMSTVLGKVSPAMRIAHEDTVGSVAPLFVFGT